MADLEERIRQAIANPTQPPPQQLDSQRSRGTTTGGGSLTDPLEERIRRAILSGGQGQPAEPSSESEKPREPPLPASEAPPGFDLPNEFPAATGFANEGLRAGDVGGAVIGGARDALVNFADTVHRGAFEVAKWGERNGLAVPGAPKLPEEAGPSLLGGVLPEVEKAPEEAPQAGLLNSARDVERFILGFMGGGIAARGLGLATNTFAGASAAGAIGDFFVTGPNDGRLVDFFDSFPALQGDVLNALKTDGNDDYWKHKLAASAEGVLVGAAIEPLIKAVSALRGVIKAQESGDREAVGRALEEMQPQLQEALAELQGWHGSPHSFEKFDLTKAGTGEGTQAFGRGHYIAEAKGTGEYYRDLKQLPAPPDGDLLKEYAHSFLLDGEKNPDKALEIMREALAKNEGRIGSELRGAGFPTEEHEALLEKAIRDYPKAEGNLYGVNVKANAGQMLDWDKPLSEQPASAVEKLEQIPAFKEHLERLRTADEAAATSDNPFLKSGTNFPEMTGEDIYRALSRALGSDEAASKALLDAGIPGLRFLDAGSRRAGEGTRNMVIFSDDGLEITSKNGVPVTPPSYKPPGEIQPNGQHELFPEVVRREAAIHDIQLQVKGDRWIDPETGKEKLLPMSNRAREELLATAKDPSSPVHLDKLSPETREELLRVLSSDAEAARWFAPKTVRGAPFALDASRKADFDAALEASLTVPYATLKASRPGTAIEDVLGSFFNYRYMDSPEAVKTTLSQLADVMKPMVDKHLGGFPQTFDRVRELADWLGSKPDTLTAVLSQQARGAENLPAMVVAGKTWIQSLTTDILRITKMVDSGLATDTARIELERRKDILQDLIGTVKSVQTSAARTTAAGRIRTAADFSAEDVQVLMKEIGEDSFKFVSRALALSDGNPKAVISLLEPSRGKKTLGVLNEFWINGLLSGVPTHVINLVTGVRNTALFPLFRGVGGLLTGDMRSVRIALGQYSALRSTVFDSLEMARRALVTENAYVDSIYHQVERERTWIKADTFGADPNETLGHAIDFLGNVIRMPSRFLTSSDEFLKQMNYRASVISRAKVEAVERGLKDELTVPYFINGEKKMISQVDEYVMDRMNEAFHPRLENGMDASALDDARRATFTRPLRQANWFGATTSLGEVFQNAAAKMPWFRHLVTPFTRVPSNIIRELIYESPAAPLRAQWWADVKAGGTARSDAVGRLALGSLFWTGGAMLAAEGFITGKGPSDPVLQKQLRATGWQPYSIKLAGAGQDGEDVYISYNRFDPVSGMLGIAADAAYIMAHVDERTQDQLASTLALSLANNFSSRSYLRSLTELLSLIGLPNGSRGVIDVDRWLKSRASSYVPRIVSSFNNDDTLRDARNAVEAVMAKVPGLSSTLPPQRDQFGEPLMAAPGWPVTAINPFAISIGKDGAARKELAYWAESPIRAQFIMPPTGIDGVIDLRDFTNEHTGQNAYDRWLEVLTEPRFDGKTTEERLDEIVSSGGYKELKKAGVEDPFYRKHPAAEFLQDRFSEHYKAAQQMMLAEPGFEDLARALAAYRANKDAVPVGASPPPNPTLEDLLSKGR